MSFLKELSEVLKVTPEGPAKARLIRWTSELRDAFGQFTVSCSKDDMRHLVACWSLAEIALAQLPPLPEHGPKGGKMPKPSNNKLTDAA